MDWILFDMDLCHGRVNALQKRKTRVLVLILRGLTESDPGLSNMDGISNMECLPTILISFFVLDVGSCREYNNG